MAVLGIGSYDVEVTQVMLGITGESPALVDASQSALDGTFPYQMIKTAIDSADD